jgi:hypothetical protein
MIGQAIANADTLYPNLWAVVPPAMKSGTTLTMPDTRGRVSVGYSSADARFNSIGLLGGFYDAIVPTHEHYVGDHTHTVADHTHGVTHNHSGSSGTVSADHTHGVGMDGAGDHSHAISIGPSAGNYTNAAGGHGGVAGITNLGTSGGGTHAHNTWTGGISTNHTHGITVDTNSFNAAYMNATHGGGLNCAWMSTTHGGANIATYANTAQTAVTNRNLQPYVTFLKIIRAA